MSTRKLLLTVNGLSLEESDILGRSIPGCTTYRTLDTNGESLTQVFGEREEPREDSIEDKKQRLVDKRELLRKRRFDLQKEIDSVLGRISDVNAELLALSDAQSNL